jgi:glycosyltransferase involved in cell wall biosynthesis
MNATPILGSKRRVLFIARRYPPTRGGAQTHAWKLYTYLAARMPVRLVALRAASVMHLAWFMPWAFLRAAAALLLRRVDLVYFSDGVTASLALPLSLVRGRARFCCSLYGLEMTFGNPLFNALMRLGTSRCDGIAVISDNSVAIAEREWGLPRQRMRMIPLGAEPEELTSERDDELRRAFEQEHGVVFGRDRILLNIGRQVPRKGMAAFLEQGAALLPDDVHLLIVGGGPDAERIQRAHEALPNRERVRVLGILEEDLCSMLRRHCDLFIMPNVSTPGDVEGYGIAPLEAMYFGTPVVAFAVDALVEAVREGGWLIEPQDYAAFVGAIRAYFDLSAEQREATRRKTRDYCLREYGWDTTSSRYVDYFEEL